MLVERMALEVTASIAYGWDRNRNRRSKRLRADSTDAHV